MSSHVYLGNVEGTRFAAVHTLVKSEQVAAKFRLEVLSPGHVEQTKHGWVAAVLDQSAPEDLQPYLGNEVIDVGEVDIAIVEDYMGQTTVKNLFSIDSSNKGELQS